MKSLRGRRVIGLGRKPGETNRLLRGRSLLGTMAFLLVVPGAGAPRAWAQAEPPRGSEGPTPIAQPAAQAGPTDGASSAQSDSPEAVPTLPAQAYTTRVQSDAAPVGSIAVDRSARPRFMVAGISRASVVRDGGYRLFTADDASLARGAVAGYDVVAGDGGALGLGAGFLWESMKGRLDGPISADLDLLTVFAEARARVTLLPWLAPHARLSGGATRGKTTVRTRSAALTGTDWSPSGSVGGGLTFRTPPIRMMNMGGRPVFALSLAIEGGYAFGGALKVRLGGERDEPGMPAPSQPAVRDVIPVQQVSLGDLSRGFPYASATAALHF